MAKTKKIIESEGVSSWGFNTVNSNGIAPTSRVQTANDAFTICWNLRLDNAGRERKWGRIYKCYKGFPPTDYSQVASRQLQGMSNVPFRQMKFIVDNQKSSFVDMVMERNTAANISTKLGNPTEKREWSDNISVGFDRMLRQWVSYNYNVELDVEEMTLYGKGFEIAEDRDGWPTKSFHNSNVLIPDKTYADLSNLGEMCIKRSYTPLEFWLKITGGEEDTVKAREYATEMGWNFWACVDALRMFTTNYRNTYTNTEWLRDVASGNMNLSRLYTLRIEIYELYIMEFNGSISKMLLLQNYGGMVEGYRESEGMKKLTEEEYRQRTGFLYYKKDWVEADGDGWEDIIAPMTDSTGSGIWHEIQGLAEAVFVQCRAYDIHMNRFMDSVDWNTRLMLEGGSAESTKKLKQMEWMPWMVLPQDVKPSQVSVHIPFEQILSGIQFYQADLYRGIGAYNIGNTSKTGKAKTKKEAEMDAAESAKLQGTQIRRFNDNQTRWLKMLYKRMSNTTKGGNGYKLKQKFMEYMDECGVPKEAWQWKNIENIESNMLSGSGSPSYKLMAAQQTVSLTGMTPMNEGQANAIADAIAALNGRSNVSRYVKKTNVQIPDEQGIISMENIGMTDPKGNAANFRVYPDQNHVEHFNGHFQDAVASMQEAQQALQSSGVNQQTPTRGQQAQGVSDEAFHLVRDIYACLIRFKGAHLTAHLQFIEKDPSKKEMAKQFAQQMQQLQRGTDELGSQLSQIEKAKQQEGQDQQQQGMSPEQVKLHALVAKESIQTDALQKKENIKLASMAHKAKLHDAMAMEKASTDLATKRAKAQNEIQIKRAKASHDANLAEDQHEQELDHNEQQNAQDLQAQQAAIAQQEQVTQENPQSGQENG
jgi:hypothetical protein